MQTSAIKLNDLSLLVRGSEKCSISQVQEDSTHTLLLMSIPMSSYVYLASSVIGSLNKELTNVGSSVQFTTGPNEVRF